jgi:hypothetical protein
MFSNHYWVQIWTQKWALKSHIFDRVWACQGVPCGDQRSRLEHFLDQSGAKQRSECNRGNDMLPSGAEIVRGWPRVAPNRMAEAALGTYGWGGWAAGAEI